MLFLNTASRTCRLGLKLHPQTRQVATFVEDSLLSEQAEICHATFARTDQGSSHVRMCVHRIKAAGTNREEDFSVR
jgi:hypothetical protein